MRFKIQVSVRAADGAEREWKDLRPAGAPYAYTWDTRDAAETALRSMYHQQGPDVVRVVEA